MIAALLAFSPLTLASDVIIAARPIDQYQSARPGERVGQLIWRGGLVLRGPEQFGGVSGITFIDRQRFIMVIDQGLLVSGTLKNRIDGRPKELEDVQIVPIRNSKNEPLPPNYSRDAEAVETIFRDGQAAAIRLGFENLTRVADFELEDGRPVGPAREIPIPAWLSALRTNESIESVCIAPDTSPVSGSTLLITETRLNEQGAHSAWLLGNRDRGALAMEVTSGFSPTDCAFLPNGDLLVLERGAGIFGFTMQLLRIKGDQVFPGSLMKGEVILTGSGGDIDNMEGVAVRRTKEGTTRIIIVSDDNFNSWERTLLLEFELPE